jgi:hypothetical protein
MNIEQVYHDGVPVNVAKAVRHGWRSGPKRVLVWYSRFLREMSEQFRKLPTSQRKEWVRSPWGLVRQTVLPPVKRIKQASFEAHRAFMYMRILAWPQECADRAASDITMYRQYVFGWLPCHEQQFLYVASAITLGNAQGGTAKDLVAAAGVTDSETRQYIVRLMDRGLLMAIDSPQGKRWIVDDPLLLAGVGMTLSRRYRRELKKTPAAIMEECMARARALLQ